MQNFRTRPAQTGVTLLESMIGILIFSVGILAVVGLQAMAIRSVAESKYRVDASFFANEIIAQMWVNRPALATFAYPGGGSPALPNWVARVQGALPGAAANAPSIVIGAGNSVTVTIFWQHPEEANLSPAPPPHEYTAITSIN
ncbi:MAG: type IV pilus modification protein PilV [Burkholderiales bacterium]